MIKDFDVHPIQAGILRELLFVTSAGFGQLNKKKISTDLFSFHIRQLANWKLLTKIDTKYSLTAKGKEFANRFDTEENEVEKQAKVAVLIVVSKRIGSKRLYLLQQRLKQPYYGFWGFVTGKLKWGETILEGARRELIEETDLDGEFKIAGIKHKMDYDQEGNILEDKYFWVISVTQIKGELVADFEGGKNVWMTRREIEERADLFDGVLESLDMAMGDKFEMSEQKYKVGGY
ncbi:NUDIX hydrolase [Candidatus Shapirobacteria bacterium]|nr:NUDIX hydrolase [Candidatus Shapirobacteria bacterium]